MQNIDPDRTPFLEFPFLPFTRTEWRYLRLPNFKRLKNFFPFEPKYNDIRGFRHDVIPVIVPESNPIALMLRQDVAREIFPGLLLRPRRMVSYLLEHPRAHPNCLYIEPNHYLLIPSGPPLLDPAVTAILTFQENVRLFHENFRENVRVRQQSKGISAMVGISRRVFDDGRVSLGLKMTQTREPGRPITPSVMLEFEYSPGRWSLEDTTPIWSPFISISNFKLPREASVRWGSDSLEMEFQLRQHISWGVATNHGLESIFNFQDLSSMFNSMYDHTFIGLSGSRVMPQAWTRDRLLTTKRTTKIFLPSIPRLLKVRFSTEDSLQTTAPTPPLETSAIEPLSDAFGVTQTFFQHVSGIICSYGFMIHVGNFVVVSLVSIGSFSVYIFVMSLQSRLKNPTHRQLLSLVQITLAPFFLNALTLAILHVMYNLVSRRDIFYKVKGLQKLIHYAQVTSGKAPGELVIYGKDALPALSIAFSATTTILTIASFKRIVIFISQDFNIRVCLCCTAYLLLTLSGKSYFYQWAVTSPKRVTD